MVSDHTNSLMRIYETLRSDHGPLGWWPGKSQFEIIVGAILTQNTAWKNAEKALDRLRTLRWLESETMERQSEDRIAEAIRPSGYYRQKAKKLLHFLEYLRREHGGSLEMMDRLPTDRLRRDLLGLWGVGPETADSILLYAFQRPVFVVDTYTLRLLGRHGLCQSVDYEKVRAYLESHLPRDEQLYNDFHAQIVWVGQRYCSPRPRCDGCPLRPHLSRGVTVNGRTPAAGASVRADPRSRR